MKTIERTRGEQIVQEIRQRETREIQISLPARTQGAADDLLAYKADDAAQQDGARPDRRSKEDDACLSLVLLFCAHGATE